MPIRCIYNTQPNKHTLNQTLTYRLHKRLHLSLEKPKQDCKWKESHDSPFLDHILFHYEYNVSPFIPEIKHWEWLTLRERGLGKWKLRWCLWVQALKCGARLDGARMGRGRWINKRGRGMDFTRCEKNMLFCFRGCKEGREMQQHWVQFNKDRVQMDRTTEAR